ncbi:uncharacterized protein LOC126974368 [Leptidea sinapis]|uniref:uncharacterized protein LOC126974368 n=1 Tax=Leptidea sinapis TaxID=189913 RepID=UPI0021C413D9|nr:uncharacterized protein LOC126974368 [Leptidea sinapis]
MDNPKSVNVSHSAIKIMDLLENSSSPLAEVKRLSGFINHDLNKSKPDGASRIAYNKQELFISNKAPMLLLKQKARLMDKTSAARQIMSSHSSFSRSVPYPSPER